jgi:hypothetical protein
MVWGPKEHHFPLEAYGLDPDIYSSRKCQKVSVLAGLRHLDLCCMVQRRDEDLSDTAINKLSRLTQLTRLNLSGHAALSSRGLAFVSRLTGLQYVDLSGGTPTRSFWS